MSVRNGSSSSLEFNRKDEPDNNEDDDSSYWNNSSVNEDASESELSDDDDSNNTVNSCELMNDLFEVAATSEGSGDSSSRNEPLLVIHLPKLCGYDPDAAECEMISSQLEEIFNQEGSFYKKSFEMFENGGSIGLAIHADTDSITKLIPNDTKFVKYCVLQYPSLLEGRETRQLWNRIAHRRCKIDVVQLLLDLIQRTSRDLLWKVDMHAEVLKLVRECTLKEWKNEREEKLEKLYDIREVFEARLRDAEEEHISFVEQREELFTERLAEAGISMEEIKLLERVVYEATELSLTRETNHVVMDEGHDFADDECDSDDTNEYQKQRSYESFHDDELINEGFDDIDKTQIKFSRERRNARAIRRAQRKRGIIVETQSIEAERARLQLLKSRVEEINNSCIKTDERIAEANVKSLVSQLEKVDELLETLQEEVWADEEEKQVNDHENKFNDSKKETHQFSLLDQILAMVLLTLPNIDNLPQDAFLRYKQTKHDEIIKGWVSQFGFLPTAIASEETKDLNAERLEHPDEENISSALNEMVINDNDSSGVDDWEELADEKFEIKSKNEVIGNCQTKRDQRFSLRPGGGIDRS